MKHSEPLILNKEEFFEGFDNPSLQEKVVGIKIALLQNDNGEIGLGLGIEAPPLHSREIEEINRFFAKKYNAGEMMQKLLQHYQDQRSQNADRKSQSDQKYEITDIAHPQYPWLHRIRALQDVREDVHAVMKKPTVWLSRSRALLPNPNTSHFEGRERFMNSAHCGLTSPSGK